MQRLRNTSGHVTSTTLNVNHTAEEAATTEMAAGERLSPVRTVSADRERGSSGARKD